MSEEEKKLRDLVLAPYILKASALIWKERRVGGNQFRHSFATLGILLDYKYFFDSVLLKAALIHDLIEEDPSTDIDELRTIDKDAPLVVELVLEVTRGQNEDKSQYLRRILESGSINAKLLKIADRISNLTDLNSDSTAEDDIANYLVDTEQFVVPMAKQVNEYFVKELNDLISRRRTLTVNH